MRFTKLSTGRIQHCLPTKPVISLCRAGFEGFHDQSNLPTTNVLRCRWLQHRAIQLVAAVLGESRQQTRSMGFHSPEIQPPQVIVNGGYRRLWSPTNNKTLLLLEAARISALVLRVPYPPQLFEVDSLNRPPCVDALVWLSILNELEVYPTPMRNPCLGNLRHCRQTLALPHHTSIILGRAAKEFAESRSPIITT